MQKQAALLLGVFVCLTATVRADVPPSPVPIIELRSFEAPLVVKPGAVNDPQMYIRLPNHYTPQRHAPVFPHLSTLIAGLALTLAFTFAGLWLVRGGRRRKIGGGFFLLIAVGFVGISGCPPRSPKTIFDYYDERLDSPVVQENGSLKGEALLQQETDRSAIEIVVPSKELASFTQAQSGR